MAKKVESESKEQVVVTKHGELSSRSVLEKMRKSELIDLVIGTETRLNEQVDLVALRGAKIDGLEHQVAKLNDLNKAASKAVDDAQELLRKVRSELAIAKHDADANKVLVDDLTSQLELAGRLSKREIDDCHAKISALEAELARLKGRAFWARLLNKQ
jgi:hypothetical protein